MFKNTDFIFDGISSVDKGLSIVTVDGNGFMERPFGIIQNVIEETYKGMEDSFFYGVSREPLTFPLTFAILDKNIKWDEDKKSDIINWLFQSDYKPLISEDRPDITYYVIAVSDHKIVTNGADEGYITIQYKMSHPYAFTTKQLEEYDIDQVDNIIELENRSNIRDYKHYPIFEFTLTGNTTDISFINLSDGGRELKFTGLNVGETVFVDNKRGEIISSTGLPRISKCNRKWLSLTDGVNRIKITTNNGGGIHLKVEMKFPVNF